MPSSPLSTPRLEAILSAIPRLTITVVGDLYLDRYLDIDAALTEPSIETGLDAYQVVRVRSNPGAAGTVINNLVALGVGRIRPISIIGRDGEGRELMQALEAMGRVELDSVIERSDRRTPTYTKPMLMQPGQPARELNRLDIHNRTPTPTDAESSIIDLLDRTWSESDGVVILDQVSLEDCGVLTKRVRARLAELGERDRRRPALADSRARIGLFRGVCLKPNEREAMAATGCSDHDSAVVTLAASVGRMVFMTRGERGILLVCPDGAGVTVDAFPVKGPIDPVGAGDSTSAGIICALACGASPPAAAALGNLVASVTVTKLGTTGTATPDELRARWAQVV